jgi:hypothetical protein
MPPFGSTRQPLIKTALIAGTAAAAVELIPVLGIQALMLGVSPMRVFQSIASGLLGAAAYRDGPAAVFLGIGSHWLISFVAALIFGWVATRWADIVTHWILSGLGYGVLAFAVMSAIVVPLSAVAFKPNANPVLMMLSLLIHMVFFGLPIALATRWRFERLARRTAVPDRAGGTARAPVAGGTTCTK